MVAPERVGLVAAGNPMSALPRYCCKSRFAQVIKNSAGCRRVFGVKMWGDMSPRVKLTGDFGNAIEGIRISNRLPPLVVAKNSWRCNFRLLQQYPPESYRTADIREVGLAPILLRKSSISAVTWGARDYAAPLIIPSLGSEIDRPRGQITDYARHAEAAGGGRATSFARRRRFCAMAASVNSS